MFDFSSFSERKFLFILSRIQNYKMFNNFQKYQENPKKVTDKWKFVKFNLFTMDSTALPTVYLYGHADRLPRKPWQPLYRNHGDADAWRGTGSARQFQTSVIQLPTRRRRWKAVFVFRTSWLAFGDSRRSSFFPRSIGRSGTGTTRAHWHKSHTHAIAKSDQ